MRLDSKTLATLQPPPGKADHIAWDSELVGFGLRTRQGGRRVWLVQYRPTNSRRTRRITLGAVEKLSPAQAREAARKLLARVALGQDPQGEKAEQRAREQRTFRSAVEAYLAAKLPELRPISYRITALYLRGPYFHALHSMGVNEITHPDVAACLSAIVRKHSTHTAAAARRAVSAFFRWTMEEGWRTLPSPVIGTRRPADPRPRDLVLSNVELMHIWNSAGDDDFSRIIRLLILLGSRPQEVGGMRWSEFDFDAGTWTLPSERSKNHRAHTIALPPTALGIIRAVPRAERDQLFGHRAGAGFTAWSYDRQNLNQRLGGRVKRPWQLRDIRRTVATRLGDIGIPPHIVEAVLNHYSNRTGVAGTYNRSFYERDVTNALARWDEHLRALLEGRERKVVPMPTRA
jgi:integrase